MARRVWLCLAGVILLSLSALGTHLLSEGAGVAEATLSEVSTIVGVDADPTGNSSTYVGTIDPCISVNRDDVFYVDLFIKDVADLNKWEGSFRFDGSLIEVTQVTSTQGILEVMSGSSVMRFSDSLPNTSDNFNVGAIDTDYVPETGSGILARLELTALAEGTSRMYFTVWWPFGTSGVRLLDDSDSPIGDLDGDKEFDGLVFNAIVVVGGPCQPDPDLDGFTNTEESIDGSDLLNASSTPEMCDDADNDLDLGTDEWYDRAPVNLTPDCIDAASNTDGDGEFNPTDTDDDDDDFSDAREAFLATDSLADCPVNGYHNAWPLDINNDRSLSLVGDVLNFVGTTGSGYGDGVYRKRLDLNGDLSISLVGDVLQYVGQVGGSCTL